MKISEEQDAFLSYCEASARKAAKEAVAKVVRNKKGKMPSIKWIGKILRHGDGVMIPSNSVMLPGKKAGEEADRFSEVAEQIEDLNIHTEHPGEQGQTRIQCNPLQIGQILEIKDKTKTKSISLKIRLFYRPGDSSSSIWQIKN